MILTYFRLAIISATCSLGHFHLSRQSTALTERISRGPTTWLMEYSLHGKYSFVHCASQKTRSKGVSVGCKKEFESALSAFLDFFFVGSRLCLCRVNCGQLKKWE
jgi:hypothetical protein